jgi:hypothetical protein
MKHKRHNPIAEGFSEGIKIIRRLRSTEQLLNQGQSIADLCRALDVFAATYHNWQQLYGGMKATEGNTSKSSNRTTAGSSNCSLPLNSIKPCSSPWLPRSSRN